MPTPVEKVVQETAKQLKLYHRWKRQVQEGVKRGEYAEEVLSLIRYLKELPPPDAIFSAVCASDWLINADDATREVCLGYINEAMARWRIRHGLSSYDDGFYDEPPSEFVLIRRLLTREGV